MSRHPAPSQYKDKFVLRLEDGMRLCLADYAKAEKRSMNSEIVMRLQHSTAQDLEIKRLNTVLDLLIAQNQQLAQRLKELDGHCPPIGRLPASHGVQP